MMPKNYAFVNRLSKANCTLYKPSSASKCAKEYLLTISQ